MCDMTTSTPSLAVHIAAWAAAQGVSSIDAPVFAEETLLKAASLDYVRWSETAFTGALPLLKLQR